MSNSTKRKLEYIKETKELLKAALIEKGQPVRDTDTFRSYVDKVRAIEGGGSSNLVKYVTFVGADGSMLYKMPVLNGDDCKDPVKGQYIDTPIKESTVSEVFTYDGWSFASDGETDLTALQAVTEDKVVYATFTSSVRKYLVTFYDGDMVVNTVEVAYGGSSSYTYKKDNNIFTGWIPEPKNIVKDINCYAQFIESYAFADASWEYISQMSTSGLAQEVFALGDTKTVNIAGNDHELVIVGFNHDEMTDGNQHSITIMSRTVTTAVHVNDKNTNDLYYPNTTLYSNLVGLLTLALPQELKDVVRKSQKKCICASVYGSTKNYSMATYDLLFWAPSAGEMGYNLTPQTGYRDGEAYPYYIKFYLPGTTSDKKSVWTRSNAGNGDWYRTDGSSTYTLAYYNAGIYSTFGFCV